jgi:hypothetical protein
MALFAAPVRADDLCVALHRVLDAAPNQFRSLEREAIGTHEARQAAIVLPGAQLCLVSARHQYQCTWRPPMIGTSPRAVQISYQRFFGQVSACFPPARVHANEWRANFVLPEGEISMLVDIRAQDPRIELSVSAWGRPSLAGWFHHQHGFDASGFYLPVRPVALGSWQLRNITIGPLRELADFEMGKRPPEGYAPFMLELEDLASPSQTNELGQEYHVGQSRVLPDTYDVSASIVRFHARDKRFGEVSFDGRLDAAALARAKNAPAGTPLSVVLAGRLAIGGVVFDGVQFMWFVGD